MFRIILCLLMFYSFVKVNAQSEELQGKWILVRTLLNDNKRVEINHPDYSKKLVLEVKKNALNINGENYKAKFKDDKVRVESRTEYDFSFQIKEKYLIAQSLQGNTTNYFLKVDDFIHRFPEFRLKETVYNDEVVYLDNGISAYSFNHDLSYDMFILFNGIQNSDKIPPRDPESIPLQFEYILSIDNKIKSFNVINSQNKALDNDYIQRFNKASKYFVNTTDKDVLIRYHGVNTVSYPELTDADEKRFYEISAELDRFYHKNEFKKATSLYEEYINLKIRPNRFNKINDENNIRFGVSFLAQNNLKDACIVFNKVGDITDFRVRNYLLDFCEKR